MNTETKVTVRWCNFHDGLAEPDCKVQGKIVDLEMTVADLKNAIASEFDDMGSPLDGEADGELLTASAASELESYRAIHSQLVELNQEANRLRNELEETEEQIESLRVPHAEASASLLAELA